VRFLARVVLIMIAVTTSAARLHGHTADMVAATQEMNRCLRLVNVAASRRQSEKSRRACATTSAPPSAAVAAQRV
jgi:hypothetical protein